MYHTEYQSTLRFTSLSCNRLLVVTTDYTLVLYLCRGEGSTYGNGGKQPSYICFENNGGLGTIGKNNGKNAYCLGQ
jgi:hypothetical protein